MEIHTQQVDGILVAALEGELDAYWAEEAERELWACLEQGHYRLVLDLDRLTYLSSAGLRVLLRFHQRIVSLGGELTLAAPQPFVREVLETSGFDRTLTVYETMDQALAAAAPSAVIADIWATAEAHTTPVGAFRFLPGEPGTAHLRVIGQADDFLYSRATLERLTTLDLSELGYALGVGAIGEPGPMVLERLGESVSVPGAIYWLPGDSRQVPDYLIADRSPIQNPILNTQYPKLPVHLLYALSLEGPYQFYGRFAADQEDGASLDDVTRELLNWAEQKGASSQAVGLALRADVASLWGVGLKRPPRVENAPANGQKINHRENIKDWLHFPTEPAFANHTLLAVGVLGEQGNKRAGAQGSTAAHIHGATFRFVPELGGEQRLEDELAQVMQQGELVSVAHLLPNTRLRKALFGLWIFDDMKREEGTSHG